MLLWAVLDQLDLLAVSHHVLIHLFWLNELALSLLLGEEVTASRCVSVAVRHCDHFLVNAGFTTCISEIERAIDEARDIMD